MKTRIFAFILIARICAEAYAADPPPRFSDQVFEITKVMLHDVISPPAAARYYAYSLLGAYLVVRQEGDASKDIISLLNGFDYSLPTADHVNIPYAAHYALLNVAQHLLPSGYRLETILATLANQYPTLSSVERAASEQHAQQITKIVLSYATADGYAALSTHQRYTPQSDEGFWYPTPPAYLGAIEPHWATLRPFLLDSATQFAPEPPTPFSLDTTSAFYQEQLLGVYRAVSERTPEQEAVARFWDCNPFEVTFSGHAAMGLKKITPGGHWIGITGIAAEQAQLSFAQSVATHTILALALHDAFISCWDEKYRSERIRPETVINRHLDPAWRPVLQTPPFPEYTSGHSVVSSASAVVLTALFGENFSFADSTEVLFGLPVRKFDSFNEAAEEAAISRLYGGIHYRDACENGVTQGRRVGEFISQKTGIVSGEY